MTATPKPWEDAEVGELDAATRNALDAEEPDDAVLSLEHPDESALRGARQFGEGREVRVDVRLAAVALECLPLVGTRAAEHRVARGSDLAVEEQHLALEAREAAHGEHRHAREDRSGRLGGAEQARDALGLSEERGRRVGERRRHAEARLLVDGRECRDIPRVRRRDRHGPRSAGERGEFGPLEDRRREPREAGSVIVEEPRRLVRSRLGGLGHAPKTTPFRADRPRDALRGPDPSWFCLGCCLGTPRRRGGVVA